jgi:hypothetical protein
MGKFNRATTTFNNTREGNYGAAAKSGAALGLEFAYDNVGPGRAAKGLKRGLSLLGVSDENIVMGGLAKAADPDFDAAVDGGVKTGAWLGKKAKSLGNGANGKPGKYDRAHEDGATGGFRTRFTAGSSGQENDQKEAKLDDADGTIGSTQRILAKREGTELHEWLKEHAITKEDMRAIADLKGIDLYQNPVILSGPLMTNETLLGSEIYEPVASLKIENQDEPPILVPINDEVWHFIGILAEAQGEWLDIPATGTNYDYWDRDPVVWTAESLHQLEWFANIAVDDPQGLAASRVKGSNHGGEELAQALGEMHIQLNDNFYKGTASPRLHYWKYSGATGTKYASYDREHWALPSQMPPKCNQMQVKNPNGEVFPLRFGISWKPTDDGANWPPHQTQIYYLDELHEHSFEDNTPWMKTTEELKSL